MSSFLKICVFERNVERLTNAEREGSREISGGMEIHPKEKSKN